MARLICNGYDFRAELATRGWTADIRINMTSGEVGLIEEWTKVSGEYVSKVLLVNIGDNPSTVGVPVGATCYIDDMIEFSAVLAKSYDKVGEVD